MRKLVALTMMISFLAATTAYSKPKKEETIGAGAIVAVVGIYFLAKHHGKKQDEKQSEFLSKPAPRT